MITRHFFPNVAMLKVAVSEARAEARRASLRRCGKGMAISRGAHILVFDTKGNVLAGEASAWPFTGTARQFKELSALLTHDARVACITIEGGFNRTTRLRDCANGALECGGGEWCVTFGAREVEAGERTAQHAAQVAAARAALDTGSFRPALPARAAGPRSARNEVLATFCRRLHEGEEQLALLHCAALVPHFIVRCGDSALRFTLTGTRVGEPRHCHPWNATRFSRQDAKTVADETGTCGGQRCEAVPLLAAVEAEVARLRRLVTLLEAQPA